MPFLRSLYSSKGGSRRRLGGGRNRRQSLIRRPSEFNITGHEAIVSTEYTLDKITQAQSNPKVTKLELEDVIHREENTLSVFGAIVDLVAHEDDRKEWQYIKFIDTLHLEPHDNDNDNDNNINKELQKYINHRQFLWGQIEKYCHDKPVQFSVKLELVAGSSIGMIEDVLSTFMNSDILESIDFGGGLYGVKDSDIPYELANLCRQDFDDDGSCNDSNNESEEGENDDDLYLKEMIVLSVSLSCTNNATASGNNAAMLLKSCLSQIRSLAHSNASLKRVESALLASSVVYKEQPPPSPQKKNSPSSRFGLQNNSAGSAARPIPGEANFDCDSSEDTRGLARTSSLPHFTVSPVRDPSRYKKRLVRRNSTAGLTTTRRASLTHHSATVSSPVSDLSSRGYKKRLVRRNSIGADLSRSYNKRLVRRNSIGAGKLIEVTNDRQIPLPKDTCSGKVHDEMNSSAKNNSHRIRRHNTIGCCYSDSKQPIETVPSPKDCSSKRQHDDGMASTNQLPDASTLTLDSSSSGTSNSQAPQRIPRSQRVGHHNSTGNSKACCTPSKANEILRNDTTHSTSSIESGGSKSSRKSQRFQREKSQRFAASRNSSGQHKCNKKVKTALISKSSNNILSKRDFMVRSYSDQSLMIEKGDKIPPPDYDWKLAKVGPGSNCENKVMKRDKLVRSNSDQSLMITKGNNKAIVYDWLPTTPTTTRRKNKFRRSKSAAMIGGEVSPPSKPSSKPDFRWDKMEHNVPRRRSTTSATSDRNRNKAKTTGLARSRTMD